MKTAVIGGGAWGTALAVHLARREHEVRLWLRDPAAVESIVRDRVSRRLPDIRLDPSIQATADLAQALVDSEVVVVAAPSSACRAMYRTLAGLLTHPVALVSATKGIEIDSLARMSQVATAEAPGHGIAVLSGPSFALEVARGLPTTIVVASAEPALTERLQHALSDVTFRAYGSDDVVGVELGGALKNVVAIAAGIVDGLGYGANTGAALITRGLAEISRLALALGGRAETLAGLSGLGDLVLTCTGALSRNRSLGRALGRGATVEEARAEVGAVAEGVRTTLAACRLGAQAGVELPIAEQMRAVLYDGCPPRDAVDALMSRRLKWE